MTAWRALPALLVIGFIGCASDSSSTAPTPAAAASFINLVGLWNGTFTSTTETTGPTPGTPNSSTVERCAVVYSIASQSGGQFSGTYAESGGATAAMCTAAGAITGTIAPDGTLTAFSLNGPIQVGNPACSVTNSSSGYHGTFSSTTGNFVATDEVSCPATAGGSQSGTLQQKITRVIFLVRQAV